MADQDKALATQLSNIEDKTGKSLAELTTIVKESGLEKHAAIRTMLKERFELGYGDANTIAHVARKAIAEPAGNWGQTTVDDQMAVYYSGKKEHLRPIHDAIMNAVQKFGAFEIAPKKTYLSLRRKKQFAMVGPATNSRVDVGLNCKDLEVHERLLVQPPKSMCSHIVRVTVVSEVDADLLRWLREAFDAAE